MRHVCRLLEVAASRMPDVYSGEKELRNLASNVHVYVESTCASLMHRSVYSSHLLFVQNCFKVLCTSVS